MTPRDRVTGVILAGGRSRRMGGRDKGLMRLAGRPLIEYVITALRPQVDHLVINANRNLDAYAAYGCRVVADAIDGYLGPLAGIASAMLVARTQYVLAVPCDCPFLPRDLAKRMLDAIKRERVEVCVAHDGRRIQPVFVLLRRDLAQDLLEDLNSGACKAELWVKSRRFAPADFSDDPWAFWNINTPQDRTAATKKIRTLAVKKSLMA